MLSNTHYATKPHSDAKLADAEKLRIMSEMPSVAHGLMRELCDAAEARRESFWKLHRMECLVEFKHRYNGRKPSTLEMIL
jgi:hypothetical protein